MPNAKVNLGTVSHEVDTLLTKHWRPEKWQVLPSHFIRQCYELPCNGPFKFILSKSNKAAPVAEWVRSLYFSALNHSIISPLCLVKVRALHWPHVRQDKFCLRVCQVVFPRYSRFAPPIDWLVSMLEIILKGTLN